MTEWLIKALVIGFVAWVIWSVLQPQYAFEIRIKDGHAEARRGKVTATFLHMVAETCQAGGVVQGWIGGVRRGRQTALRFSRHFPPNIQQRLRNAWYAAG
jgi:hypothetical protein